MPTNWPELRNLLLPLLALLIILLPGLIQRWRARPAKIPRVPIPYGVFTRQFDQELSVATLPSLLGELSASFRKYWRPENDAEWQAAVSQANDLAKTIPDHTAQAKSNSIISILIDHSGSMRGKKMIAIAAAVIRASQMLGKSGIHHEILGFTTDGWQGGRARELWISKKRPRYPGRLCALLHLIYKEADEAELDEIAWKAMLNPGILYENIDGEAVEWAASRLASRPEARKVLLVVSDGAPVDDSTLTQNGGAILEQHIRKAIAQVEASQDISLFAFGVGHQVDRYYSQSRAVEDIDEVAGALTDYIMELAAADLKDHPSAN